jgi:hypothetical protein
MQKKKKIDNKKLMKMIQDGLPQKEIMDKMEFKTSTQFKIAYLNAAMESDIVPKIKTGRGSAETVISKQVEVNKRGSLIIPKPLVDDMGFKEGDTFEARKTKAGVSLKKVEVKASA